MTNKPIPGFTAAMREACAKAAGQAAWKCEDQPDIDDAYKWQTQECVDAVLAMPVVPMFPEPMRELPEYGQAIWIVNLSRMSFCEEWRWVGGAYNMRDLRSGLFHASKEAAEAHGRYLASLSAKTEDAV